jgi:hypothetical protein
MFDRFIQCSCTVVNPGRGDCSVKGITGGIDRFRSTEQSPGRLQRSGGQGSPLGLNVIDQAFDRACTHSVYVLGQVVRR